ncbi:transporter substrate-binding domain-containing protein [Eubacteriaceae bacterium ES3]|nr:transporter substrate-binding domain-containing protein [Eubacteriaceae bacterium ES3]
MKGAIRFLASFLTLFMIICPVTVLARDESIDWTPEEVAFMEAHPVITVGVDPQFVPFEFFDDTGDYQGIASDYLEIISQKTGLTMEIQEGLTWTQAYDQALSGEIDLLPAISKTSLREESFLFSEPYYNFKRVIVIRDSTDGISGIDDLYGQTVAVQKNSSHHSFLSEYDDINLSLYDTVEEALTAVANGTETAFVGNLATTNYLIRSSGLTDLKYIAFDADDGQGIYFAVQKDMPELVEILNKSIDSISAEEKIAINNRWVGVDIETDYSEIFRVIFIVAGLIILIWLVSVYWIIRLRREIETRKRVQADLEIATEEAEKANQIKSSFMARMSHEIRTPLNAIMGMSYLVKKTPLNLTQKMYLDRITQSANTMLSIINDILDFSKIEAGKIEVENVPFNMDQVIQDVINIVSHKIEEQRIGFNLTKDPRMPNCYFGAPKRIEQILLNLINNSAKFTNEGEIGLDIRMIAKTSNRIQLAFTVSDTGIGMSEEQTKKLFEPFTQADASINRRFGGTGLGLSIVKNLVEMMAGSIKVFSEQGEGSTFIIELELTIDEEAEATYKDYVSSLYFKEIKTLVLDKSGSNINMLDNYLSAFGIKCEFTTSAKAVVNILETGAGKFSKPFDLLIVDYETPPGDALKYIEQLLENSKIIHKPKILMLIPMMRDDLFELLEGSGIDVGVLKPVIPSVLFNGIMEIFRTKAIVANEAYKSESETLQVQEYDYGVLIVEDNKTNQLIAKSLLESEGFKVFMADNGEDGVEQFKIHQDEINLILMDLHMPVLNGYQAAEKIHSIADTVPIVAMTADVIDGVIEKCREYGMENYISKPFDPSKMIQLVIELIESQGQNVSDKEKSKGINPEHSEEDEILNSEAGIKYMGGNETLYRNVVEAFFKENKDILNVISPMIDSHDYKEAALTVHKIKSSSGSIGAKNLVKLASKFQKALEAKDSEEIQEFYVYFEKQIELLMEMIESYLMKKD